MTLIKMIGALAIWAGFPQSSRALRDGDSVMWRWISDVPFAKATTVLVGTMKESSYSHPGSCDDGSSGPGGAEVFGLGTSAGFGTSSAGVCRKSGLLGAPASLRPCSKDLGPFADVAS